MKSRAAICAVGLLLAGCSLFAGDERVEKSCQALNDRATMVLGVSRASWEMINPGGMPTCSGSIDLDSRLSAAEQGDAVGSVYDLVRDSGQGVAISTTISISDVVLRVRSGFPTAATVTGMLELMAKAGSPTGELSGVSNVTATVKAGLSSTSPGASLREAASWLSIAPPEGVETVHWNLHESQIISRSISSDVAAGLETLALWFDEHPVVTAFSLRQDGNAWDLTTAIEVPDDVRAFADLAAGVWSEPVTVKARLPGAAPYLTVP